MANSRRSASRSTPEPWDVVESWTETPSDVRRENEGKCEGIVVVCSKIDRAINYTCLCDKKHAHQETILVSRRGDGRTERRRIRKHSEIRTGTDKDGNPIGLPTVSEIYRYAAKRRKEREQEEKRRARVKGPGKTAPSLKNVARLIRTMPASMTPEERQKRLMELLKQAPRIMAEPPRQPDAPAVG